MEDLQYFSRKINEGTISATHVCSFDPSIVLTRIVQRGSKVIDSLVTSSAIMNDKNTGKQDKELFIRKELEGLISSVRINGSRILLDDLGNAFNEVEIVEVMAFINRADMSAFGGKAITESEEKENEAKNA